MTMPHNAVIIAQLKAASAVIKTHFSNLTVDKTIEIAGEILNAMDTAFDREVKKHEERKS